MIHNPNKKISLANLIISTLFYVHTLSIKVYIYIL